MELSKELLEAIERLGDQLTFTSELAKNIYKQVRKEYGMYSNTLGVWQCMINLERASENYTNFHLAFLSNFTGF